MSTDRDVTRIVRSWLDEGVTALPDRVLDAVLDQIPATSQRRATWWPAWRVPLLNNTALRFGLAAAALVLVTIAGIRLLPGLNSGGDVTPTLSPTPTPTPQVLGNSPLDAGNVVATGFGASESVSFTFTVPEGWEGFSRVCVLPITGTVAPDGMGICFGEVNAGLYSDPCHGSTGQADVPVGPTVEDLANALAQQTVYETTTPTDVTLGGYSGKRMDLHLPSDVASCDLGEFYPWGGSIYAQGPENQWHLWILDVKGDRVVIIATSFPGTSAEDLAEQQAIVDSIRIEP
jgi:hypothetical protein